MSEEVIREIEVLLKGSTPSSFIAGGDSSRETIYQKSKKLSFDERAKLLQSWIVYPGTVLCDAGGAFEARIYIDDKYTKLSKNKPLAYIEFSDGYKSRVEVIDILESVRSDATLIGHPVIVFAIHHWQQLLAWEKYSKSDDVYSDNQRNKDIDYLVSGKHIKSAKDNFKAIGNALLEGARNQTVPKEVVLDMKITELGIKEKNTYLYVAWQRLHKKHIDETSEATKRIKDIESYLEQLSAYHSLLGDDVFPDETQYDIAEFQQHGWINSPIRFEVVVDFLKADGRKFVYNEKEEQSLRPNWQTFYTAFINWFYKKSGSTVGDYQNRAKKQLVDTVPYTPSFWGPPPTAGLYDLIYKTLVTPLKLFCEPIECRAGTIDSHHFTELIEKAKQNHPS